MNISDLLTDNLDIWTSAIERRSTAGRGRSKKFGLYGIEKLRALILDLAVQGKLVAQDLSESVEAELTQICRPKGQQKAEVNSSKEFSVPVNWLRAKFGTIFVLEYGDNLPEKARTQTGEYPVYGSNGVVGSHVAASVPEPCIVVGRKGSAGAINLCLADGCWVTDVAYSCIPPRGVTLHFATIIFRTAGLIELGKGIKPGLSRNEAYALNISVPPLAEQHRIVAKVDELMGLCDRLEAGTYDAISAHQLLVSELLAMLTASKTAADFAQSWQRIEANFDTIFNTEDSIDQLKQTILQLAVMGRLVPQDANDEPASELLKLLSQEREQINKGSKVKTDTKLKSIPLVDQPFEVPASWSWVKLGELTKLVTSGSRDWAKHYADEGAIFVRMGNLSKGHYQLRLDQIQYVNPPIDGEGSRTRLEAGDILISITGDVGMLGLIPEGFGEAYINQHTAMIRPLPLMRGLFLAELFRSPMAQAQFNEPQRGIKNSFRLTDITEFMVPLPPLAEQHRVVKRIDELLMLCEVLKSQLSKAQIQQVQFADAIASRAVT